MWEANHVFQVVNTKSIGWIWFFIHICVAKIKLTYNQLT
jgi:hypothetical protein